MILLSMQISGVGPIGLSQQCETQRDCTSKIIYVQQGGWLCSFVIKITSTRFELKESYSSLDNIRICPDSLVEQITPLFFQSVSKYSTLERSQRAKKPSPCYSPRHYTEDSSQCSSGWLRRFSLKQMDLLENIFQPYGQVPWDDLINPL